VLERRHRLTSSAGFTATTRGGRRAGSRTLVLHLALRDSPATEASTDVPRVGFAVGRTLGNAVTRNRVRRRLRHLVRERLARLPRSADLVVRALPAAADASYTSLGLDLDRALDQALGRLGVSGAARSLPAGERMESTR
jgi:ribonuclease P protein component